MDRQGDRHGEDARANRFERTRRQLIGDTAKTGAGLAALGALPAGLATAPAALAQGPPPPNLGSPPFGNAQYWAFADWCQGGLEKFWRGDVGVYDGDSRVNAAALITHSIAAQVGWTGPSRKDSRAIGIAAKLLGNPPYIPPPGPGRSTGVTNPRVSSQAHTPGWVSSFSSDKSQQHISIDPKIAEGLISAYRARAQLGLPAATAEAIRAAIPAVAAGVFFKYPNIRLNQINWGAELYAYSAELTGSRDLLVNDFREQLVRWLKGARKVTKPWTLTNLSPSYSFHRDPFAPLSGPENVESAEYANIVLDVVLRYQVARDAGMPALEGEELETLRNWVSRALPAYWTHSGYMNWDTGMAFKRWHLGRYWGFAVQGLFAIVLSPELRTAQEGRWAKWIFDRALATYERLAVDRGPGNEIPESPLYGIKSSFGLAPGDFLTRFQFHAARAVFYGFAGLPAAEPPPLWAYDPTIGRVAITTPTYNTAIMATNNGSFPYGGLELARLFDGDQRPAGCVGGYGGGGFGVICENTRGGTVLATQEPRATSSSPLLTVTRSPRGRIKGGRSYPSRPYSGSFSTLAVTATKRNQGVTATTTNTFRAASIQTSWSLSRSGSTAVSAEVRFPTYGGGGQIVAELKNGGRQTLRSGSSVSVADVAYFVCLGQGVGQAGYVVVPDRASSGAVARVAQPKAQKSNTEPGPSLAIRLARASRWSSLRLETTIATVASLDDAPAVARSLGAG